MNNVIQFPGRNFAPPPSETELVDLNEFVTRGKSGIYCHIVRENSGELKKHDVAFVDRNRFDGLLFFENGRAVGTIVYILRLMDGGVR